MHPALALPDIDWPNALQGWIGALIGALIGAAASITVLLATLHHATGTARKASTDAQQALERQLAADRTQRSHDRLVSAMSDLVSALRAHATSARAIHLRMADWRAQEEQMLQAQDASSLAWMRLGMELLGQHERFLSLAGRARLERIARHEYLQSQGPAARGEPWQRESSTLANTVRLLTAWIAQPDERHKIEDELAAMYPHADSPELPTGRDPEDAP